MSKLTHQSEDHRTIANWEHWRESKLAEEPSEWMQKLCSAGKKNPLLWGQPQSKISDARQLLKSINKARPPWTGNDFVGQDFGVLFLAHRCIFLAENRQDWNDLVDFLVEQIEEPRQHCHLANQIRSIELPLVLAARLPDIPMSCNLSGLAIERFEFSLRTHVSAAGFLDAKVIDQTALVVASWARNRILMETLGLDFSSEEADDDFDAFVQQLAALLYDNREMMFATESQKMSKQFLATLHHYCRDSMTQRKLQSLFDPDFIGQTLSVGFEETGVCCETANIAILRDYWMPKARKLAVRFGNKLCDFEMSHGSKRLFSGSIDTSITIDETDCQQTSGWEVVCWHQDSDVEFLELEAQFEDATLQRHFLWARDDQFCLMGDTLQVPSESNLVHQFRLPLAEQMEPMQEIQNTEIYLCKSGRIESLVLPLHETEWITKTNRENWQVDNHSLSSRHSDSGLTLYHPIWIDLDRKRSQKPRTWRQLTVAEHLETCPSSEATAFRVRVGKQQWLIYRSMKNPANRTFLGQNHACEFFVGRFDKDGEVVELLTVE